jgi:hypothetical protein
MLIPISKSEMLYAINTVVSVNEPFDTSIKSAYVDYLSRSFLYRLFFSARGRYLSTAYKLSLVNSRELDKFKRILDKYQDNHVLYLSDSEYYSFFIAVKDVLKSNGVLNKENGVGILGVSESG